jgi:DNA mismatch endonuclease (patch repair protein)
MANVKSKNTCLEMMVRSELKRRGLRFVKHVKSLPGCPDLVFPKQKLAVFVDGDFWHGYRFPTWNHNLPKFWREKIAKNRDRDRRNFAKIRRMGWQVVRIWQHDIEHDLRACTNKVCLKYAEAVKRLQS